MKPLTLAMATQPVLGEAKLVELTHKLITLGARTQVIVAMTGLCDKRVRVLTKALTSSELQRGPCQFPNAKFFAGAQRKKNPNANLHSTMFLSAYVDLKSRFVEAMHEGFMLAASFEVYQEEVDRHDMNHGDGVLDINRAYALVRCYNRQEVELVRCACCDSKYLILNWYERDALTCPICAKSAHCRFLAEVGKQGGRRRIA